ncbi:hypothetical protein GCM10008967_24830 [Bacillus carboniphilus]|uniref:Uncharacterized protein n=1 Tax=Bacillus carboniphilus TaxID=86663 RepID=A0ABN0WCU4_9BACI
MKNRYLLQLLLCGVMLYYGLPRFDIYAGGAEGVFAISWLAFALFVIAGSLLGLLYTPKKATNKASKAPVRKTKRKSARSYS